MKNVNIYECTYYDLEEVVAAVKEFERAMDKLANSLDHIGADDVYGEWDITSEKGDPEIVLTTKIVIIG